MKNANQQDIQHLKAIEERRATLISQRDAEGTGSHALKILDTTNFMLSAGDDLADFLSITSPDYQRFAAEQILDNMTDWGGYKLAVNVLSPSMPGLTERLDDCERRIKALEEAKTAQKIQEYEDLRPGAPEPSEDISSEQRDAVLTFRAIKPHDWKLRLSKAWTSGKYTGVSQDQAVLLQQVRNTLGPAWLMNVTTQDLDAVERSVPSRSPQTVVDAGTHVGPVTAVTDQLICQKIGRRPDAVVWHARGNLEGLQPAVGEALQISYQKGVGKAVKLDQQRETEGVAR